MSMQQLNDLMNEFNQRFDALQAEFEVKATAIAWGMAADILGGKIPDTLPARPPNGLRSVKKVLDTSVKGTNKRQRFSLLLESRMGKWARRDSDNVYVCVGPANKADHFLMRKEGDSTKTITVSLVSLISKWNYIP